METAGVNSATTVDYWLNKESDIASWHAMAVRVFRCYFADLLRNPHTSHRTLITDAAGYPGEFTARSCHRYNDDPPLTFTAFLLQSRLKAFFKRPLNTFDLQCLLSRKKTWLHNNKTMSTAISKVTSQDKMTIMNTTKHFMTTMLECDSQR